MLNSGFKIPEYANTALRLLENGGFEGFLVGGCVRDCLMGKEPNDYDITSSALPEEMLRCFEGYRVIETGIKHGTVTVVIDGENIEVTTYRIDGEYEDNRHPKEVIFADKLSNDLSRRDFTVNAMAYNDRDGLVDLFGGVDDMKNKVIRCVGEPDRRFNEDGLRILRALRFASVLDFDIAPETEKSIRKNRGLLKNISSERIMAEMYKLICGKGAERILLSFPDVMSEIFPELECTVGFEQNNPYHGYDVYTHSVKALAAAPRDRIIRLVMLLHDIGKPGCYSEDEKGGHFYGHHELSAQMTEGLLRRMKVDNHTLKSVTQLVHDHDKEIVPTEKAVRRVISNSSFDYFYSLLDVKRADNTAQVEAVRHRQADLDLLQEIAEEIEKQDNCLSLKSLAVKGDDLIGIGFKPGRKIGIVLNSLLQKVIDGELPNEKEALLAEAMHNA